MADVSKPATGAVKLPGVDVARSHSGAKQTVHACNPPGCPYYLSRRSALVSDLLNVGPNTVPQFSIDNIEHKAATPTEVLEILVFFFLPVVTCKYNHLLPLRYMEKPSST